MPDKLYNFPIDDFRANAVHTPSGVISLAESSELMTLLRNMQNDGHEVSGPVAELVALINYVSSSNRVMSDIETHIAYCSVQVRQQLNLS